jgi:hypothetical protein
MAQNTSPIFSLTGNIDWGTTALTAANTAKDGTGTTLNVCTADATNGSFVQRIRFRAAGTNVATVARVFINNGSSSATPANNILWDEITLSATTLSEVAALATFELPLNFVLPAGYTLLVALGTAVSAGYYISTIGGNY